MPTSHAARLATAVATLVLALTGTLAGATEASARAVPTTSYGAGYFVNTSSANGLASVSVQYTLPAFTCASNADQEWLLPGAWAFSGAGLSGDWAAVELNCNNGATPLMQLDACTQYGCKTDTATAAPGDKIRSSIAFTPTAAIATTTDLTKHVKVQVVTAAVPPDTSIFIGDLGPSTAVSTVVAVPTFTKVSFSNVYVNGEPLADSATLTRDNLKTTSVVQISSGLIAASGLAFSTTFKHN